MSLIERLNIIEKEVYKMKNPVEEEKEKCCICLEDMDKTKNLVILTCGHSIDFLCFMALSLNSNSDPSENKCPLCRTPLITKEFYDEIKQDSNEGTIQRVISERRDLLGYEASLNSDFSLNLTLMEIFNLSLNADRIINTVVDNDFIVSGLNLDQELNCDEWIIYIMGSYRDGDELLSMDDIYNILNDNLNFVYSVDTIRGSVSRLVRNNRLLKTRSQGVGNGRTFMYQINPNT